jgi:hypothetical protein
VTDNDTNMPDEVPDEVPEVHLIRATREELRAEHAALLLAVALAVDDAQLLEEGRMRAGGNPIDAMLTWAHAAELIAEQLDVSRDEAIDDLRARLGRFVARHGQHLIDDEPT